MLLEHRGLRVRLQKFDPYINVDPGTMSPYQHGEVYVLDDGAETDLDLGHYERFTNAPLSRDCNYTTGKIYLSVIEKERQRRLPRQDRAGHPARHRRDQGGHPQAGRPTTSTSSSPRSAAPSATSKGCRSSKRSASSPSTSARQNCLYIHLTLVPYLKAAGEPKTKPTQHSRRRAAADRHPARHPHLPHRARDWPRTTPRRSPCSATSSRGPSSRRRDKEFSIYEVPLSLVENKLDELIVEKLQPARPSRSTSTTGGRCSQRIMQPGPRSDDRRRRQVHQAPRRLQVDLRIARPRRHRPSHAGCVVRKIEAEEIEREGAERVLSGVDGILVPGGFGIAASTARSRRSATPARRKIPFFGICLGLQCAVDRVRPQRRSASPTPTAPSSTRNCRTPSSACSTSSTTITDNGRHDAARRLSRACCAEGSKAHAGLRRDADRTNAIATATSSTTSTASSSRPTA